MKLENAEVIVERPYKTVYKDGNRIVKVFSEEHGKANVFNEALCHSRVEESGFDVPEVLEVSKTDNNKWALAIEYVEGRTLESMMLADPAKIETYMEKFVDLQLEMHKVTVPRLGLQKEKLARKIAGEKELIDATTRYELDTRLESMPKHTKLCHGDFVPSNVIVKDDGSMTIVDWSHATKGNASGDAALTYLQFALKDQGIAEMYLNMFCKKSDTARQYVQKWMPIVAAARLSKGIEEEKEFLLKWIDIIDFQ